MDTLSVFSDERYMKEALKEAMEAYEQGEIPVGAVVVCKNRIVARAYNQTERLNDATAHAEMLAITAAANTIGSKYLNECTLYVTLEPCVMCGGASSWSQLGKVVYGADDPVRGFNRFEGILHPKTTIHKGIMAKECGDLVTRFFEELRMKKKTRG